MITVDPSSMDFTYAGGSEYVTVFYPDRQTSINPTSSASWVTVEGYAGNEDYEEYVITVSESTSQSARFARITFSYIDDNGDQWANYLYITQGGVRVGSIWQDTFYISEVESLTYYLKLNGEVIFRGKAFRNPGDSVLKINVARICQDYLTLNMPDLSLYNDDVFASPEAYMVFDLYVSDYIETSYKFLYSWSYKDWNGTRTVLSDPINGHLDPRMKMLITQYSNAVTPVFSYVLNGVSHTKTFRTYVSTWVRDCNDIRTLTFRPLKYVGGYCGDYALYYRNRNGGFDSFLIEGNTSKKEKYQRSSSWSAFDNNDTLAFGRNNYHNEITTSYTLHTGWLSDEESEKLAFHLLPSNLVYLHNLAENTIIPVLITDSEVKYKTFKNNSKKLVNYEITVEEGQWKQLV